MKKPEPLPQTGKLEIEKESRVLKNTVPTLEMVVTRSEVDGHKQSTISVSFNDKKYSVAGTDREVVDARIFNMHYQQMKDCDFFIFHTSVVLKTEKGIMLLIAKRMLIAYGDNYKLKKSCQGMSTIASGKKLVEMTDIDSDISFFYQEHDSGDFVEVEIRSGDTVQNLEVPLYTPEGWVVKDGIRQLVTVSVSN